MTESRTPAADAAPDPGIAAHLHRYLREARSTLVSRLEGLDEYDLRRPLTPSGTNLLGLKHLVGVELAYLGDSVGRPAPVTLPWVADGSIWDSADMWATPEQSSEYLLELYRTAWQHTDESFAELGLDAPAYVEWWAEERRHTTFGALIVRCGSETAQRAGHADIVRELIDGRGGEDHDDIGDAQWWSDYVSKIQSAADAFRPGVTQPFLDLGAVTTLPFPSPTMPRASTAEVFLGYLDFYRSTVIAKTRGLSDADLRQSRLPSGWSPIELLNHLRYVELRWLVWGFEGREVPDPWGDRRDNLWYVPEGRSLVDVVTALEAQGAITRAIVERNALTDVGQPGPRWSGASPATLERVLFHLVQEYARHAGQLDVVRELIDGTTGE